MLEFNYERSNIIQQYVFITAREANDFRYCGDDNSLFNFITMYELWEV